MEEQPLFRGMSFSEHMNRELRAVRNYIDNASCAKIAEKTDRQLSEELDNLIEPIYAKTIPVLETSKIEKLFKAESNSLLWEIPYTGDGTFFTFSPSQGTIGQRAELFGGKIRISERLHAANAADNVAREHAEASLRKKIETLEETLAQLRTDLKTQFGKTKTKDVFLQCFVEKRDKCIASVPDGYKLV